MPVEDSFIFSGEVALTFLGENIPAIGPRFENRDEAIKVARLYFERISANTAERFLEAISNNISPFFSGLRS